MEDLSVVAPNAARFGPLPVERHDRWSNFPKREGGPYFPHLVGFILDDLRLDYARLRLPFRAELRQPAGVVHGGVFATLIDSVFVPAIGSGYDDPRGFSTVDLDVRYLGAVVDADLLAEGWVVKRGRSIVFCAAEVRTTPDGELVATGNATFKVSRA
ncbi:MAG: PaaI family thioesterase [Actinomycetota bacterium]